MSTNGTSSICPAPFLPVVSFPETGGATNARFCAPMPIGKGLTNTCCLPCPKQNFFYPDHFEKIIHGTTYINLASVVACCFLLISFAVLPQEYTHRHYLSVCLAFGILLMQTSFVIPMGNPGSQCYDRITAHDMYSSMNCALSGAFLLGGGWCTVTWVFLRTLSLHLQICWQMVPGRKFFLAAQAAGWSIPVVFLALALTMTGVSFRFGESCHINSKNGLQSFWGPLLAVAAGSIVTQAITFFYCIQVYLKSLFEEKGSTRQATGGSGLPYTNSIRTVTARQALRRIRRVVALQWRGITVILIILADAVYFAAVLLQFDGTTEKTPENYKHGTAWVTCMILSGGDKYKCLEVAKPLVVEEVKALAVLFLLSLNGLWALLLLGRASIYKGWWEMIKNLCTRKKLVNEFVSYDARRISEPGSSTYEMLESKARETMSSNQSILKPERSLSSATRTTTIREYNPITFSAQLRERSAESGMGIASPPFSPYHDTYSVRSPPISSPFSPFRDHPDYMSRPATANSPGSPPRSPYADSPVGRDGTPKPPGAIGIAQ